MQALPWKTGISMAELGEWWASHGWPSLPEDALPETGFVVEDRGAKLCAGFLYLTNSSQGWVEYIVANPQFTGKRRWAAINFLLDQLIELGRAAGCKTLFTSLKHKGLIRTYASKGFAFGDDGMTNMVGKF